MALRSTPVHRCLLEVKSAGGAEFAPTVGNITVCLVMLIGPNLFWWPVLSYFMHKLLQWMFYKDPQLSLIFLRYLREADVYDPWPQATQFINKRPFGAGRDLLC